MWISIILILFELINSDNRKKMVFDDPILDLYDFGKIYEKCESINYYEEMDYVKEHIKSTYSVKKYKKFCMEHIGEWSGNNSGCSDDD